MTKLVTQPPPAGVEAVPGETDFEWHRLRRDHAAVLAAIKDLAAAFELKPLGPGRWMLTSTEPPVNGTLVVRMDDASSTSIGLRIAPVPPENALQEAVEMVITVWPFWLFLAIVFFAIGNSRYVAAFYALLIAAACVLPTAAGFKALEASRVRRDRRHIVEWRNNFLARLEAHFTDERPYR